LLRRMIGRCIPRILITDHRYIFFWSLQLEGSPLVEAQNDKFSGEASACLPPDVRTVFRCSNRNLPQTLELSVILVTVTTMALHTIESYDGIDPSKTLQSEPDPLTLRSQVREFRFRIHLVSVQIAWFMLIMLHRLYHVDCEIPFYLKIELQICAQTTRRYIVSCACNG
jgi:hypothetical protein